MSENGIPQFFLILLAALFIFFPNRVWKIAESWKNDAHSSPTKLYLLLMRIIGGILLVAAIVSLKIF